MGRYWQCSACRHQASLRSGTVFDNTKLPLTTWLLALEEQGHAHTDIVSPGRAGCEQEHARWVNIVLSNPKRSLDGTHHAFAYFKYAHRTLAEAAWQFNRRFDLAARVPRLLVAAATTKPWSERQLRDVPVYAS